MFQKFIEKAVVNGRKKEIEIRKDEIWERYCRIIDRAGLEIDKEEDFNEIIEKPCIFCMPEKLAKFGDEIGKERLENEYAFLFPNINPYAKYSSVCAFKKHYMSLNEFKPEMIEKNLELSMEYIRIVEEIDNVRYASINWNYMMPSGASILHPHMQTIVNSIPTTYIHKIIQKKDKFMKYIEEEIKRERFIGRIGNFLLFCPFAPFGFNEVFGFSKEKNLRDLANAICNIISYYGKIRRNSFNLSVFISLNNEFPLHFRIITRQNMVKFYRNDAMFFERLHFETILEKKPEDVCREIREYMKKN